MIQMRTIMIRGRESGGGELRREVSVPAEVWSVPTIGDSRSKVWYQVDPKNHDGSDDGKSCSSGGLHWELKQKNMDSRHCKDSAGNKVASRSEVGLIAGTLESEGWFLAGGTVPDAGYLT
jgi:hypothetical protein